MNKPDRRTERTRAALMQAFVGALLAEGYEAVTVEAVCDRANIGRSTFYMHYTGKEDILRQSMARPSMVLAVLVGNEVPRDLLVKQLLHFHEQRRRNHLFFEGPVRTIWVQCLAALIEPRLAALARHLRARAVLPLPMAARQIAEGQLALIGGWLTGSPATKVEAVADALGATSRAAVAALLGLTPGTAQALPGEKLSFRTEA